MPVTEASILTVLRERASLKPNNVAFTFLDYEHDPAGAAKTLTWSQLYRGALNVAQELQPLRSARQSGADLGATGP